MPRLDGRIDPARIAAPGAVVGDTLVWDGQRFRPGGGAATSVRTAVDPVTQAAVPGGDVTINLTFTGLDSNLDSTVPTWASISLDGTTLLIGEPGVYAIHLYGAYQNSTTLAATLTVEPLSSGSFQRAPLALPNPPGIDGQFIHIDTVVPFLGFGFYEGAGVTVTLQVRDTTGSVEWVGGDLSVTKLS